MPLSKIISAGASERQQFLTHNYNDNTIRFVLNYPGLLDPDALCSAVKAVVESVDILHSTFFNDSVRAYWHVNDSVDEIHYFHYVRCAGDPAETAYSISLFPVFPEDRVQLRVWLVQSDSASSMVVAISHLCVDGGDGKYLLGKIIEGYNRILSSGSAEGLEIKNGSRAPEKVYEGLSLKEIMGLMRPPVSNVMSLFPFANEEPGRVQYLRKVIPAQTMSGARAHAKTIGASANDLLVAALCQVYKELPGVDKEAPLSVTSMMDLRKHCKSGESEGLCNMSGAMPTVLEKGACENFEETLKAITAQTTAIKEDPYAGMVGMPLIHTAIRTAPMGLLLKVCHIIYGKMSLGVTNLGNIRCADYTMGELIPDGGFFGGPVKKKPGMQVAVMSFDGECVLSICGQFTQEDRVLLDSMLDNMVSIITDYAN